MSEAIIIRAEARFSRRRDNADEKRARAAVVARARHAVMPKTALAEVEQDTPAES